MCIRDRYQRRVRGVDPSMKLPEAKPCHRRYYTPSELAQHNTPDDCWLSWFGDIYDLSPVLEQNTGIESKPLVDSAGTDISHWFDPETLNLRQRYGDDLVKLSFAPLGEVLHKPPAGPRSNWANDFGTPWWKDETLRIAQLSGKQRPIRVINTLTQQEHVMEVCVEETCHEILERYLDYNKHAESYTWKRLGYILDMDKTLEENGVMDETETLSELGLPDDYYVPALHLYFNDDLSVA
eukprot:TRINITY_DN8493_c0_g1_i4.p1 TRINITY_DN8493_c0_g1~~TRINITY_DN8493_c0_g1_i4.p1  ORF type:complete len:238 (-),score=59.17 TRINITY_DN8493_c0_g1_i4:288-1001(-)